MKTRNKYALALVMLCLLSVQALAGFTPPTSITKYLPAQNTVTVAAVTPSTVPLTDEYNVTPTDTPASPKFVLYVTSGTSATQVQSLASGNISFNKFLADTVPVSQQSNPFTLQAALIWYMNNIGKPYYGL